MSELYNLSFNNAAIYLVSVRSILFSYASNNLFIRLRNDILQAKIYTVIFTSRSKSYYLLICVQCVRFVLLALLHELLVYKFLAICNGMVKLTFIKPYAQSFSGNAIVVA